MNLRFRVGLSISLVGIACLAVIAYMLIDYKRRSIDQEIEAGTRVAIQLLQAIAPSPIELSQISDPMDSLVDYLGNVGRVRANEVRVYDEHEMLLYESPPSEYKQGRWAPDWFTALVAPDTGEVRLPVPGGFILITPDSSRSVLDAWDELWQFALFVLVIIILLNIAVYQILGRTLKPLNDIVNALTEMEKGNYGVRLENYNLPEFNAISHTFNRMAESLQAALIENARLAKEEQQRMAAELELEQNRKFTQLMQVKLEDERRSIARELHDELGQCVTAIKTIGTAIANRDNAQADQTRENARTIVEVASHIYDVVHSMIRQLRPSALDHLGLNDAIGELVDQYRKQHPKLAIHLVTEETLDDFEESLNITVYRIVQECLTNVVKHADASKVDVALTLKAGDPTLLQVSISDDGKGLKHNFPGSNPERNSRFGLIGIKERVQAFGGELNYELNTDGGTTILVTLPIPQDCP
ncbi:ATP-binding protein [Pseudohongiella spirulinae]|uniref:histidine kinase n=1 Tax=Pseudohongiella spirulinae TaxID=1249552 RepID=A0A0S2KGJ6_9GAMM|nr:ATP-binding protein [Pseudohongiella spirulinae]ALO47441.1 Histidine kinase [Pseudohongiella spirulinae]